MNKNTAILVSRPQSRPSCAHSTPVLHPEAPSATPQGPRGTAAAAVHNARRGARPKLAAGGEERAARAPLPPGAPGPLPLSQRAVPGLPEDEEPPAAPAAGRCLSGAGPPPPGCVRRLTGGAVAERLRLRSLPGRLRHRPPLPGLGAAAAPGAARRREDASVRRGRRRGEGSGGRRRWELPAQPPPPRPKRSAVVCETQDGGAAVSGGGRRAGGRRGRGAAAPAGRGSRRPWPPARAGGGLQAPGTERGPRGEACPYPPRCAPGAAALPAGAGAAPPPPRGKGGSRPVGAGALLPPAGCARWAGRAPPACLAPSLARYCLAVAAGEGPALSPRPGRHRLPGPAGSGRAGAGGAGGGEPGRNLGAGCCWPPARGGLIPFGSVLPSSALRQPRSRSLCVALLATGRTEEECSESSLGEEGEEVPSRSGCRSWSSRPGSRAARTRAGARADGRTDGLTAPQADGSGRAMKLWLPSCVASRGVAERGRAWSSGTVSVQAKLGKTSGLLWRGCLCPGARSDARLSPRSACAALEINTGFSKPCNGGGSGSLKGLRGSAVGSVVW
ncbi:translation initiation factor IF-2-like [Melopsittacus undulatus]|uniref:translation initiation factor IF-2-like n=1 Tax=Melopsittacus undulatus TaxID=13146 RepID=UPI00146DF48B|nr:translation initiation factor IF-2-like [Melopsittacus undulatus]